MVLDWIAADVSFRRVPFLLSLRLSLIPFALRFLTAGLRANAPHEEFRRTCADCRSTEMAEDGLPPLA